MGVGTGGGETVQEQRRKIGCWDKALGKAKEAGKSGRDGLKRLSVHNNVGDLEDGFRLRRLAEFVLRVNELESAFGRPQVSDYARLHSNVREISEEFEGALESICAANLALGEISDPEEQRAAILLANKNADEAYKCASDKVWGFVQSSNLRTRLAAKASGDKQCERIEISGGRHERVGVAAFFALPALIGTDAWKTCKTLAVSGASALSACLVAVGEPPIDISAIREEESLGQPEGSLEEKTEIQRIVGRVNAAIGDKVLGFIDSPERTALNEETEAKLQALKVKLLGWDDTTSDDMVTFEDLELLARVCPEQFKELEISAEGCIPEDDIPSSAWAAKRINFNARTTPDIPVVFAALAASPEWVSESDVTFDVGQERLVFRSNRSNESACDLKLVTGFTRKPRSFMDSVRNFFSSSCLGRASEKSDDQDAETLLDVDLKDRAVRSSNAELAVLEALVGALPQIGSEHCDITSLTSHGVTAVGQPSHARKLPSREKNWKERLKQYKEEAKAESNQKEAIEAQPADPKEGYKKFLLRQIKHWEDEGESERAARIRNQLQNLG